MSLLREKEQQGHSQVLVVGHAVLFWALTDSWLSNCQLVELDMDRGPRDRCQCSGFVCRCDNPEFDASEHT